MHGDLSSSLIYLKQFTITKLDNERNTVFSRRAFYQILFTIFDICIYFFKKKSNLKDPWILIISRYLQTTIILWSPSFFVQNMTSMEWYFLIIFVDIISERKILNIIKVLYLFLIVFSKNQFWQRKWNLNKYYWFDKSSFYEI